MGNQLWQLTKGRKFPPSWHFIPDSCFRTDSTPVHAPWLRGSVDLNENPLVSSWAAAAGCPTPWFLCHASPCAHSKQQELEGWVNSQPVASVPRCSPAGCCVRWNWDKISPGSPLLGSQTCSRPLAQSVCLFIPSVFQFQAWWLLVEQRPFFPYPYAHRIYSLWSACFLLARCTRPVESVTRCLQSPVSFWASWQCPALPQQLSCPCLLFLHPRNKLDIEGPLLQALGSVKAGTLPFTPPKKGKKN